LWGDADADLQPLTDARLEFARLDTAPRTATD
jgi:hypothetical protein